MRVFAAVVQTGAFLLECSSPSMMATTWKTNGNNELVPNTKPKSGDLHPRYGKANKEFDESQFLIEKLLGEGHFGKIYRASMQFPLQIGSEEDSHTYANENAQSSSLNFYALKQFSKSHLIKSSQKKGNRLMELLKREIGIHRRLDHPHIINFFGHIHGATHLGLVLEYAPYGDLFGYMAQLPSSLDRLFITQHVMCQVSTALDYLKCRYVSHRDIKPENILVVEVGKHPIFKLCDFGWAVRYSKSTWQTTLCGTPEYVPIEMLTESDGKLSYDAEYVDLWALGVLMYELLHGITPFYVEEDSNSERKTTELIYEEIRSFQSVQFLRMDCVTVECFNLMDSLLQIDPLNRCSALEVINHPFLSHGYLA